MTNPLLTMDSLPPFSQIQPDQVQPAVTQAIADCKQKIEDVLAQKEPHTWDSLIAPLEEVNDRLSRIWSPSATSTPCRTARRCGRLTMPACRCFPNSRPMSVSMKGSIKPIWPSPRAMTSPAG